MLFSGLIGPCSYVCYVLKDKLVRVINRIQGQKCLLKHHSERITQIKFSSTDDSVLCTADAGTGANSHVFIIQLVANETEVESVVLQEVRKMKEIDRPVQLSQHLDLPLPFVSALSPS